MVALYGATKTAIGQRQSGEATINPAMKIDDVVDVHCVKYEIWLRRLEVHKKIDAS